MSNGLSGLELVAIKNLIELYPWIVEVARERKASQGTQCQQPTPQPRTPRPPLSLFEEVANLCDWVENTWMGSHKDKTISVRLALDAEKKRQELVDWLISVAEGHRYKATNLDIALRAIENFEKGESQ
jgi:hypothetical protein